MGEEGDWSDEEAPTRGDAERVLRITAIKNRFDAILFFFFFFITLQPRVE